jgi:hypothetical protein
MIFELERAVLGIIIFAFVSAVLKITFHEPARTINDDDLIKAANEINAHVPIVIDSTSHHKSTALHTLLPEARVERANQTKQEHPLRVII